MDKLERYLTNNSANTDLTIFGWSICIDTLPKPVVATTDYVNLTIILNSTYIDKLRGTLLDEVVLHEVAHALTPGHSHDEVWAGMCKTLGIEPKLTIRI